MICVPLFESNQSVGVLKVASTRPDALSNRDIEMMQLLSIALGSELGKQIHFHERERILKEYERTLIELRTEIEKRRELEKELIRMAERDIVTGLLNRRAFSKEIQKWINRASRNEGTFGVFYFDLDKFKQFNDQFGHDVGDLVLKEFVACMKNAVRESRFGGSFWRR